MIPDYQSLMLPVLKLAAKGEIRISEVIDLLADEFSLSAEERAVTMASSGQTVLYNRAQWAKTYLKQAGLLKMTKRAHFALTDRGKKVLETPSIVLDAKFLKTFPEFRDFQSRTKRAQKGISQDFLEATDIAPNTPEEVMRNAYQDIIETLAIDVIERLRTGSPAFFERTIVALLLAMGYGGSSEDAGRAIGQSGDDGVDGVVDQDPLGVDQIYVQAKRYAEGNLVGPAAIREFAGSLSIKKAQKGIFVTTSGFTKSAIETAKQISARIVLIDADDLGRLLVRHNVGCRDQEVLHIKRIDEDFFE